MDYDDIDPPKRKREYLIPRSKAEKRAAQGHGAAAADWENHIPATMIDVESLPTTGGDHVA